MSWLLLTAGRGPAECQIAVRGILDALIAEAREMGVEASLLEAEKGEHGLVSALVVLDGAGAGDFAKSWEGTVRWICASPVRPGWKRKNWFVGISRLSPPEDRAGLDPRDLRFEACRASGPGGQHVNKTNSAVRAVHLPTGLTAFAQEERSQHRNKALAIARLSQALAERHEAKRASAEQERWSRHDALERGNEVRAYAGAAFRRVG